MANARKPEKLIDIFAKKELQTFFANKHCKDIYTHRLSAYTLAHSFYVGYSPSMIRDAIMSGGRHGNPLHMIMRGNVLSQVSGSTKRTLISQEVLGNLYLECGHDWPATAAYIASDRAELIRQGKLYAEANLYLQSEKRAIVEWIVQQFVGEDKLFLELLLASRKNGNTSLHDAFSSLTIEELNVLLEPILQRMQRLSIRDQVALLSCRNNNQQTPLHVLAISNPQYLQRLAEYFSAEMMQQLFSCVQDIHPTPFHTNYQSRVMHLGFLRTYLGLTSETVRDKLIYDARGEILWFIPNIVSDNAAAELKDFLVLLGECSVVNEKYLSGPFCPKLLKVRKDLFLVALQSVNKIEALNIVSSYQQEQSPLFITMARQLNTEEMRDFLAYLTPGMVYLLRNRLRGLSSLRHEIPEVHYHVIAEMTSPFDCLAPLIDVSLFLLERYLSESSSPRYQNYLIDFFACLRALCEQRQIPPLAKNLQLSKAWYAFTEMSSDYAKLRSKLLDQKKYEQVALEFFVRDYLPNIRNLLSLSPYMASLPKQLLTTHLWKLHKDLASVPPSYAVATNQLLGTLAQAPGVDHILPMPLYATTQVPGHIPAHALTLSYVQLRIAGEMDEMALGLFTGAENAQPYLIPLNSTFAQSLLYGIYPVFVSSMPQPVELRDMMIRRTTESEPDGFALHVPCIDACHVPPAFIPVGSSFARSVFRLFGCEPPESQAGVMSSAPLVTNQLPPAYPNKN